MCSSKLLRKESNMLMSQPSSYQNRGERFDNNGGGPLLSASYAEIEESKVQ